MQWNRASLAPGETWTVNLRLVDDAALVAGGRYLHATAADGSGTEFFVGNIQLVPEPEAWMLMLGGLTLLGAGALRRKAA